MKCLFVTGTRSDFGKMKGLISALSSDESRYSIQIVATGMHSLTESGSTLVEIENTFSNKVVQIKGQKFQENMPNGSDALGALIAASNVGYIFDYGGDVFNI